ncbi:protelomerase family protein [cf. Phormidesmis sp. LEGE 11477]|uniref:protelomerase family protein n=1 Tax=cf. Phormidesmis sp. LEGE 11477 TaxID=1828680 RepID=UPI001D136388|nr:protelomerase family protein [cf. Phormidesmis sp. LEGE 11477]
MTLESGLEEAIALCSTEWLKSLLRELLPQVVGVTDTAAGHRQAQQWDALVKERMAQRGLKSLSQQKNPITDVRRVLKAIDPNHPALADVGFSPEQWTEINMPSEQAVAQRSAKPIDEPNEIARRAAVLLQSDSWSELAAGLAVATGRRAAEVIQTAQFRKASDWSVWFSGAVKRRGEPVELMFELPTLVEADSVISATERLRSRLDTEGMSNREINRAYSHAIAQACDRSFADVVPSREGKDNLYTHLFRSVYSTIATFWFCPPAVPELEFRAAIQGHYKVLEEGQTELRRSLAASRHYFDYEISDQVIAAHQGRRKGVRLGEPGVEVISAFGMADAVESDRTEQGRSHTRPAAETLETAPHTEETEEEVVMSRIGISESDKQRVLSLQDELGLGTQQDTMQMILDAADAAISLANQLGCQPFELAERVDGLGQQLDDQQRQNGQLRAKLAEAEKMGGGAGTSQVIEQSLAMAHEFNAHLKQENERLRVQLAQASDEAQALREQLVRFEAAQQQLHQLQQLLGGAINGQGARPQSSGVVSQPDRQPVPVTEAGRTSAVAGHQQRAAQTTATASPMRAGAATQEPNYSDQVEREIANLIREIMQYNDQQARDDSERWLINQSTLKQLSTRNQSIIKRVLEGQMADALKEHHDTYGLHGRMANRGKDIELLKAALGIQK